MILENPGTPPHYLTTYFPIRPALKDNDRHRNGDFFKKPTNYWFVNCQPEDNFIMEPITFREVGNIEHQKGGKSRQRERSMISPEYARRFILQHILDDQENRDNEAIR